VTARRASFWAAGLCLVAGAALWSPPAGAARQDIPATDANLEAASLGRTVRIGAVTTGGAVTVLPLEVYVARVLAGEAEASASDGAQQALAIAARTYTTVNTGRHAREGFDLCDTTHCQVWRAATASTRRAVLATAGLVLTHDGTPAEVFYSASCGGRTERAADVWARGALFPYLQAVEDDVHGGDPTWRLERTIQQVHDALERGGSRGDRLEDVRVEARSASGRVTRVGLPGMSPDAMTGDDFRGAVGFATLRSTAFTMERSGDRLIFEGRGYGHGVGMCVIGANRRGQRGDRAETILAHYFPALAIQSLTDVAGALPPPR
jgi:stage II sporulation protein D